MLIADLHIHSKYSRATSRQCTPEYLDLWARRKGIDLVGTGDLTHLGWRDELKEKLEPAENGLFLLKEEYRVPDIMTGTQNRPRFVLSAEISSIYKKNNKVRKVHNVILLPSFSAADSLAQRLEAIGNIHSDGRPILGLDSRDLLEITLSVCPEAIFIPAHIWTPHFSLFGAFSGFDTIEECFEDLTPHIHALETGLSSDPPMNLRLSVLDRFNMVSNSDAHSPAKLGREANLLDTELSYAGLKSALADHTGNQFAGTIEFFPEEGKYHLDGHRNCNVCLEPSETARYNGICPVCGKKITIGVLHRVEQLADRPAGYRPVRSKKFENLVPLPEVIAASLGLSSAAGRKVQAKYETLLRELGNEFYLLREAPLYDIERVAAFPVAEGIRRMREGQITLIPGFDGEYGKIKLFEDQELEEMSGQMSWFVFSNPEKKKKEPLPPFIADLEISSEPVPATQKAKREEKLNPAQLQAVTVEQPAVAVIAGPGTGKTKTLISRIIYLIEEKGVSPAAITAVTFTNKAAGEMRQRLEAHFGKRKVRGMQIGTFHGICLRLLAQAEDIPSIIDEFECEQLAAEVLKSYDLTLTPKKFLQLVSKMKNMGVAADNFDLPPGLFESYRRKLQDCGAMDFDDILLSGLKLAKSRELSCFQYLLVDEFQDINPLQYRLVRAWARNSKSLFVIGDPDQSIYGFRGSDAACFDNLKADYPDLFTICLEENYRSAPEIVSCALSVINKNLENNRILHPNCEAGDGVQSLVAESDYSEAIYVAREINRMVGGVDMLLAHSGKAKSDSNLEFSDICVLYRTHRQAEVLEYCLKQEGIPYLVAGRDKTLAQPSVRGVVSFFRSVLNRNDPVSRQSCIRLLLGKDPTADCARAEYETLADRFRNVVGIQPPKLLIEQLLAEVRPAAYEGIDRLLCMAVLYDHMQTFLSDVMLGQEQDVVRSGSEGYHASAVTLTTLHGAKGLEFPVTFLCGVGKGMLPLETEWYTSSVDEERRLFYVGITRAKRQLILLHAGEPSLFLKDLPGEIVKKGNTAHQKNPSGGKQLSLFDL